MHYHEVITYGENRMSSNRINLSLVQLLLDHKYTVDYSKEGRHYASKKYLNRAPFSMSVIPIDTKDLVIVPLPGELEQFLGSLQTFPDLIVLRVKLPRFLVVLHR